MKRGASTQLNKKNPKSGILPDSLSDDEFFEETSTVSHRSAAFSSRET